jgi:hypothetical protein
MTAQAAARITGVSAGTFSQHDVPAQPDATYVHAGVSRQQFPVSRSKLHSSTIAA